MTKPLLYLDVDGVLNPLDPYPVLKWAPLLRHAERRPFAWLDDVMPFRLVRNSSFRRDRLLLRVNPEQGLERHHVDRLLRRPPR